jgi:hypothetical protein
MIVHLKTTRVLQINDTIRLFAWSHQTHLHLLPLRATLRYRCIDALYKLIKHLDGLGKIVQKAQHFKHCNCKRKPSSFWEIALQASLCQWSHLRNRSSTSRILNLWAFNLLQSYRNTSLIEACCQLWGLCAKPMCLEWIHLIPYMYSTLQSQSYSHDQTLCPPIRRTIFHFKSLWCFRLLG